MQQVSARLSAKVIDIENNFGKKRNLIFSAAFVRFRGS